MRSAVKRRAPGKRTKKAGKRSPAKALSKPQRKAVVAIVKGQAETKRAVFYQGYNDGTTPISGRTQGLRKFRGFSVQNNTITNNNTDIKQLIPYVLQGLDDWSRIGSVIKPLTLTVNGTVRVNVPTYQENRIPTDVKVVIYVLQHMSLKDYDSLWARNDFNSLLDTDEGTTTYFAGEAQQLNMPLSKHNYKLLHKKVISLRYAGITNTTGSASVVASVANAHTWYADYSINLSKHLPAKLVYPESGGSALNPGTLNSPTNSSIFMCMGCIDFAQTGQTSGIANDPPTDTNVPVLPYIQQTYVSHMSYKDM